MFFSTYSILIVLATVVVVVLAAIVLVYIAVVVLRRRRQVVENRRIVRAREDFRRQRERLEARFVRLAGASGMPRGLEWVQVDFEDAVEFARDRHSRQLRALVAITIRFEAIEGGGMEDVEAVGNLRAATAIFHFDDECWDTLGRAIFNLDPLGTIRHFDQEMEVVE